MFSRFSRLFKPSSTKILTLASLTFLNAHNKLILQQTKQMKQEKQSLNGTSGCNWDRIIQINSPQQLSESDIRDKVLICYQMSGNPQVDNQVALICHLFSEQTLGTISTPYQFIFLSPSPQESQQVLIIFTSSGSKLIPFSKYLQKPNTIPFIPNYKPLFKKLIQQVSKYQELTMANINQHLNKLQTIGRDTYQLLVVSQTNHYQDVNKAKAQIQKFLKNKEVWNSQIVTAVVTDQSTRNILGLNRNNIQTNQVYLITPVNENLLVQDDKETFKIGSKPYHIIKGQDIQKSFIFPPIPPKLSQQSLLLKVNIDLNKSGIPSQLYNYLSSPSLNIPKLLSFSSNSSPIQITIERNNYDTIIHTYDKDCNFVQESKKDLLGGSHVWRYNQERIDKQSIQNFVNKVISTQPQHINQQYYKTEPQIDLQRKFSKLIVGEERKQVLQRNQDKLVFHYSKTCHSCKRFGGFYEEIAQQQKNNNIKFYRIDNDTNKSQGLKNYNSTPVFVMYKKDNLNLSWHFKMPYFTKKLFSNFIQITKQVNILDSSKFNHHIQQHKSNQSLVKQLLQQI